MKEKLHIKKQLDLVEAIKTNDELVLKQLYLNNYHKVELYILKNNGTMPQAKDTYQDAFIAVWKNIREDKFLPDNETAVQGYLYTIAKNKWLDFLRSSQYKNTSPLRKDLIENKLSEIHNGEEWAEDDKKFNCTIEAFNKLGEPCRQLLKLFYFSKKPLRSIAKELDIEEASARNKKYRCIQKLRELAQSPNNF